MTPAERLAALWDHLGLGVAHVAAPMPSDLAGFAAAHPERLGGVVLCAPVRLDPAPFVGVAERLLMIAAEEGPTAGVTAHAALRLTAARRHLLAGYAAEGWSDVVADRPAEIADSLVAFLRAHPADPPRLGAGEGTHAGITYRVEGSGPALVLLPFFLAPSQWEPAAALARHFTLVTLGGPHIGGVAALEDRARAPTYRAMFHTLVEAMMPAGGEPILEVGCGAGSLVRLLARRVGADTPIHAVDVNAFLLREAAALAVAEGLGGRFRFAPGNAEALPFEDGSIGCAYSVTVLEECDADRAIAEMVRVVRPGGRVGIVVRAVDMPQWWSLDLPEAVRAKVTPPPRSVAAAGVADRSLYRRMRQAGLVDLVPFPTLVTLDRPEGPIWRFREDHVMSVLSSDETLSWHAARDRAAEAGLLFMAHPMHAAVGTKPLQHPSEAD